MRDDDYKIEYYKNSQNNQSLVKNYIHVQDKKNQAKIDAYLELLRENKGRLNYPYVSHVKGKIWELRVDFSRNCHRIFYFIYIEKRIILLYAFLKKTKKIPQREKKKAINNYKDFINNKI